MKLNARKSEEPAPFAVVVPSVDFRPEYRLLVVNRTEDHFPGEEYPIYGSYTSPYDGGLRLYIPGDTPNDWRLAVEEDWAGRELLFVDELPPLMKELDLSEYPADAFEIRLMNCKVIPMPQPEGKVLQFTPPPEPLFRPLFGECVVIEHEATRELKRAKQYPPEQLAFPFAEPKNQQTQNAS